MCAGGHLSPLAGSLVALLVLAGLTLALSSSHTTPRLLASVEH